MIEVTHFTDEPFESSLIPIIDAAYDEARLVLDKTPETIEINFTESGASDITGVGGFANTHNQINIALIKDFQDKVLQEDNLRGTVLHESFHIHQGFTFDKSPFTALEAAMHEGCAVIFEQQYTTHPVVYADYSTHSDQELQKWLDEIKAVGTKYFEDYDTWQRWAFYHPEYEQKWIIYKVGAWLVGEILKKRHLTILDLKDMTATEIYKLI